MIKSLYIQVLIAVVIAVLFGYFNPEMAVKFKPMGDIFIKLIKMVIGPLIFCTIVSGMVESGDMRHFGKIGVKLLIYFEVMTSLALFIGLFVTKLIKPGAGMNIDVATIDSSMLDVYKQNHHEFLDFIMNIVPKTIVGAFADGEILPILFIALLFGFALSAVKDESKVISGAIKQLLEILFKIINYIMKLAPFGAFGAMAYTVGKYGVGSLTSLAVLIGSFYITCFLFVFVILGAVAKLCGFNIWKFLKYIKEEIFLVLGTSSSESALPNLMKKLEKIGCERSVVGVAIPTGYSFNLDGTCIYFTMAILFIAQATNTHLTFMQEIYIIAVLLITSKGAAGVTGSGFITLAATLSAVNIIPVSGIVLILGIDRFMSEARAITNLIGNGVATIAISKWENKIDFKKMKAVI